MLYVIVCGAGPARLVDRLVDQAQARGWQVCLIATPAALDFLDIPALEEKLGQPIRSSYRSPRAGGERSLPHADAIVVAPATYNTINKWAQGVSDTYALGILAESLGLGIPAVVLPFVNSALAAHFAFRRSIAELRAAGVRVLLGPGEWVPHQPSTGDTKLESFPWSSVLDEAERLVRTSETRRGYGDGR